MCFAERRFVMNTPDQTGLNPRHGIPRKSWLMLLLVVAALTTGISAIGQTASSAATPGNHQAGMEPAGRTADAMRQHVYSTLGVTDAQKGKLDPLMQQTGTDFGDFHAQLTSSHDELIALLSADKVDRVALERLRVAKMRELDLVSKRLVEHLGDVAEALTPAQRQRARDAMAQRQAAH
jgi:Spy/CpxP family protein refolding chaperone